MNSFSWLKTVFLGTCLCCGLIACTAFGGFKPPPEWWTYFADNGASEKEIRVAFLECGSSTPGYYTEFLTPDRKYFPETDLNEAVSVTKCMNNSGFPYKGRIDYMGRIDLCAGGATDMHGNRTKPPQVPACKSDAVIPTRSVETRLNSSYCKTYPETRLCQPVVVSEAEWNETHKKEIEARKLRLNEVRRQGYSTNVGTAEAKYCREEAKKNKTQEKAQSYFETCLKEKFKVWHPFLSY